MEEWSGEWFCVFSRIPGCLCPESLVKYIYSQAIDCKNIVCNGDRAVKYFKRIPPEAPAIIRLFIFIGIIWASLVGPMSSILILKSIGATSPQIGIYAAINAIVSILVQPIWGMVSDKLKSPRLVICICLSVSCVFFGMVIFAGYFNAALVLLIAEFVFRSSIVALLDSYTISEVSAIPGLQYGFVRISGSITYGIVSIIYSNVINASGAKAIIPISLSIAAAAVIYGVFFSKGNWEKKSGAEGSAKIAKINIRKDMSTLFRNKKYMKLIAFFIFFAIGMQPIYTFMIDVVTSVGGAAGDVPMIHAIKCFFEIPMFLLLGYISKKQFDIRKVMFVGICFYLVHMLGLVFAGSPAAVVVLYVVSTPGYVLILFGRLQYIRMVTPESIRSTSITIISACEVGIGSVAGNLIGAFVLGRYGTRGLAIMEIASLCAVLLVLLLIYLDPAPSAPAADAADTADTVDTAPAP